MKKELFPVKTDATCILDATDKPIISVWDKILGKKIPSAEAEQRTKDIASALNSTWGQGINPEAVPAMFEYISEYAKSGFPNAEIIMKMATIAQPKKDIVGKFVKCIGSSPGTSRSFNTITVDKEYAIVDADYVGENLIYIHVINDKGDNIGYAKRCFSEPYDKPKPLFTSADGAEIYPNEAYYVLQPDGTTITVNCEPFSDNMHLCFSTYKAALQAHQDRTTQTDIRGTVVTCKTDDCKSLTNGKDYRVVQGNYRDTELVYIFVVNDQGHNKGYYFTTFTEPRTAPEPKVVYCLDPEGMFLTKDKAYTVLNEDTDKAIIFITNDRAKNKWYNSDQFTSEKPKKLYAVCIDANTPHEQGKPKLTKDKAYEVISRVGGFYTVMTDLGYTELFYESRFSTPYTS